MLLSALAIAVAVQARRWGWALVLTAATVFFLVRPLLFVYYGRSPLAIQMQDGPFFWYAAVLYSLFYGAGAVVLVAIWRFVKTLDQEGDA